jgi:hypothetical protein
MHLHCPSCPYSSNKFGLHDHTSGDSQPLNQLAMFPGILLWLTRVEINASRVHLELKSMKTNFTIISPFGIDGNTHTPPMSDSPHLLSLVLLPLSSCFVRRCKCSKAWMSVPCSTTTCKFPRLAPLRLVDDLGNLVASEFFLHFPSLPHTFLP